MFHSQNNPKAEMQQKALENAVTGESLANYQAIFDGFAAMGAERHPWPWLPSGLLLDQLIPGLSKTAKFRTL